MITVHKKLQKFIIFICIIVLLTACKGQNVSKAYTILNNNVPQFTENDITSSAFESYSELDILGRCGPAIACIGEEIMPDEERDTIGQIKPSGWKMEKYDIVDGKYLYNRCHLIAYQLSGENANERNLITGTRYFNMNGMLPFENKVAQYIKETKNHVMYRVTPIFENDNLLAKGVQMEAYSVEDKGKGISFNVFIDNVQPGIVIDYLDGSSRLESDPPPDVSIDKGDEENLPESDASATMYILNTNTMKFHNADCKSAKEIKQKNKESFNGTRQWLMDSGYSPCGICKP